MRLPTGYGSIIKLGGKRRRPFAVRITAGWSDDGKQRYQYLGYFPTRKEALSCLDDYNQRPYDVEARKITFAGLYRKWVEWKYTRIHKDIPNGYRSAYKYCERLHDRVFVDLRADDIQRVIDGCQKGYSTLVLQSALPVRRPPGDRRDELRQNDRPAGRAAVTAA